MNRGPVEARRVEKLFRSWTPVLLVSAVLWAAITLGGVAVWRSLR